MAGRPNAPVIIKRKKVIAGGGHHGGAWKVAYADFVTAMMAFFLLMWLLNATTEQQKKGIADYFAPMIPLSRVSGGSDGMFGGDSLSSVDQMATDGSGANVGTPDALQGPADDAAAARAAEVAALRDIEEVLLGRGGESTISEQALRHVVTRLTDEGLIIEIFSLPDMPIFEEGTTEPTAVTRELVAMIARVSRIVTNPVAVAGYVRARPVMLVDYSVWDLSSERADTVRQLLETGGLDPARLSRLTGHADRLPAVANPAAERNDRIEITLLRTEF